MKRGVDDENSSSSSDSSDDEFMGPSLHEEPLEKEKQKTKKRKTRTIRDESKFIENIQFNEKYAYSYTQESNVSCIAQSSVKDPIIITGLKNGTIKFWRKTTPTKDKSKKKDETHDDVGQVEVIKQFSAHPQKAISQLIIDSDGRMLASIAKDDTTVKIFDMVTLDMIQVINLSFKPSFKSSFVSCWYKANSDDYLVINEQDTNKIHVLNPVDESVIVKTIHRNPLNAIVYNPKYQCIVSADTKGIVEYWTPESDELPKSIRFKYKSDTDLLDFVKKKSPPSCITLSPDCEKFACISYPDSFIKLFDFASGKLLKTYDESISIYEKNETNIHPKLINSERRYFIEDLEEILSQRNIIFDDSGRFLLFGSLLGIKILSIQSNKVIKILGTSDQLDLNLRFNQLAFCSKSSINKFSTEMLSSNNSILNSSLTKTPVLITSAVNSNKMFLFNTLSGESHTDVNLAVEPRSKEVKNTAKTKSSKAILNTTMGDIKIKLFNELVPKASENFIKLCEQGYYNSTLFHRVIKNFMIQGGDPLGNGTGGESFWGGYFKDEFNASLTHKAFMVSMANSGPDTNGSQFFITTEKAPWLDNKHTIFGEIIDGFDVIKSIENIETDSNDLPLDQIILLSTSLED